MTTPRLKLTPPRVSEKARQNGVVGLLRWTGYEVLELGQKRTPVIVDGKKHWQKITGNDTSTPDLMVSHPDWPENCWHALEMKAPDTRRRPGQVGLVERRMSVFVTSDGEAARDVLAFEQRLGLTPNARLSKWLEETP